MVTFGELGAVGVAEEVADSAVFEDVGNAQVSSGDVPATAGVAVLAGESLFVY